MGCVCISMLLRAWHLTQRWLCGQKLAENSDKVGFLPESLGGGEWGGILLTSLLLQLVGCRSQLQAEASQTHLCCWWLHS